MGERRSQSRMHLSEVMTIVIASLPDAGRSLLSRRGTPTPRAIAFHGNDKSQHSTGRTYVNYRTYAQVTE